MAALEAQGYTVKCGPNVKHMAVKPPGRDRFARLDSLGPGYTETDLTGRIAALQRGEAPAPAQVPAVYKPLPAVRYYRVRGRMPQHRGRKLHGIRALYVKYLYLLGIIPKRKPSKGAAFLLRGDTVKLDRYVARFKLMQKYRIDTAEQLDTLTGAFQAEIDGVADRRKALYHLRRQGQDVDETITAATSQLRNLRRNLDLCAQVQADLAHIRNQHTSPKSKTQKNTKEVKKHVKTPRNRSR